jgi:hypothetical protein
VSVRVCACARVPCARIVCFALPGPRAAAVTLLHLFAPYLLLSLVHPVVAHARTLLGLQWAVAAVTCGFVVSHRRHLMVWAIFAPKLVFEATISGVVTLVLLASGGA